MRSNFHNFCTIWKIIKFSTKLFVNYSRCLTLPHALSLDFNTQTTLPTHLPISTGCVFPNASSSNWRLWFTSRFMASHCSTLLMTCATLPTFQADDDYDQQVLSSWRYPELGWLLLVTEPSALLDRGVEQFTTRCHWVSDSRCFSSKTQTFHF